MTTPIIILAGQSNARALRDGVVSALTAKYGADGFALIDVHAPGAPLTFKRADADWMAGDELRAELQAAMGVALATHLDGRLEGIIWVQGEGDTHAIARAGEYATRLKTLMDGFRDAIAADFAGRETGAHSARIAISALSEGAPDAATRKQWGEVKAQQAAVAAGDTRTALVDPDLLAAANDIVAADMFLDSLHYSEMFRPLLAEALVGAATEGPVASVPAPMVGTSGGDRMHGTSGGEVMIGGQGDDIYDVNHAGDRIVEEADQGHDTVIATRSFSLRFHSQALEDLILTGKGDFSGTGNGLDNLIRGNRGDNHLDGAWGDDILRGGRGNDRLDDPEGNNRLVGGAGDDTYVIVHKGNRIVERADEGDDLVLSALTFSLQENGRNVERLSLTGTGAIDGTGNRGANQLAGNDATNVLDGRGGDDHLAGGGGDDRLIGGPGDDTLTGGEGRDVFVFRPGDGQDRITDFDPVEDRIGLDAVLARGNATLHQQGEDLVLIFHSGDAITMEGIAAAEFLPWSIFTI